ncbi:G-protein coupled receptor Mth [Acyrthosiphon pisum]|uniref:G-protein coupled receptors family 2 profile 2 domain-containing protein n=1 Tax=Acyrthosiphon pisum TaxID=7029 RepID=A0A8R2D3U1_ACYPI|nr:G-protein coupled receptor Mth [Acyrthosiphon pisum]|eukprot:XP_016658561.1 PREDICTED: G-protein coupled receptor Mth isoform X1 [Acyrthosiphon pisum]
MNTIRSRYTATVAVLVVAIGGRVASSMDNIVPGRKCCPVDRLYDPEARFCKLSGTDVDEYRQRLVNQLDHGFRVEANVSFNMTYYPLSYCNTTEVLVDVPAEEVRGLMEAHPSPIELSRDYCFDLTPSDELVARTCRPRDQYCDRGNYTCVNKCCSAGYVHRYVDDPMSWLECKNSEMPFTLSVYETDWGGSPAGRSNNTVLTYWDGQVSHKFQTIESTFMLTTDGNLHLIDEGDEWIVPNTEYCLGYYAGDGPLEAADLLVFVYPNAKRPVNYIFWVTYLPSVVCLALTLIVYATLPYLRNAHGHYVMFYMACQLVDFVCIMIYLLVYIDLKSPLCIRFGYFLLFAILTTCCWLNVICFDIYWMLRYNNSTNRNTSKSVRTIMYHIYCWGFSSTIVSTGYLFQHSQNETLRGLAPDIGKYDCDLYEHYSYGTIIFLWIPLCGMLTTNLVLFLLTAILCSRIKSDLNKFRQTDSKIEIFLVYKERFVMSIKLFLVFGIPLFFTMLCELFQIEGIIMTIITKIYFSQGVFIFIIFVAKRKVIMDLLKKFRRSTVHSDVTQSNTISRSS